MTNDKTYATAEHQEELFNALNGYVGENLEIKKDIAGAIALVNGDTVPVAYVSDGMLGDQGKSETQEYNGLHYTLREDGDVKVSNPDTQATLYLGREEIIHLLMELEQFEKQNDVRQPEQALQDAETHLGKVIDALQDAGWSNAEIQPLERFMKDVNGQRGGE